MKKPIICIKIGGKTAARKEVISGLIKEINSMEQYHFILIHGGGAEVTEASKAFGIEARFENGVRITGNSEMKIVDGVLSGKINKELVRQFHKGGVQAVGLSGSDGSIFIGEAIGEGTRTGRVTKIDTKLLHLLTDNGYMPLIASTSMCSKKFLPLNINADEAALAVAKELPADKLIFISDIMGVLKNEKVIASLNENEIKAEIEAGVISGGMIPKVNSSLEAVKSGTKEVIIGTYNNDGDLGLLIKGKQGTIIKEN